MKNPVEFLVEWNDLESIVEMNNMIKKDDISDNKHEYLWIQQTNNSWKLKKENN